MELSQSVFNNTMREIIKKSLFTERQIEIMLNQKSFEKTSFHISKGAYYRQVSQCRDKLQSLYYTIFLLQGLGMLKPDDFNVTSRLAQQILQLKEGISPEREDEVLRLINTTVKQLSQSI